MKNVHKIRGKREFLFDDRELIILGGGACLICVLIFVLGLLVGQSLQETSMAKTLDRKEDLLSEDVTPAEQKVGNTPVPKSSPQEVPGDKKKPQIASYRVLPESQEYIEVEVTPTKKSTSEPSFSQESQTEETTSEPTSTKTLEEKPSIQPLPTVSASSPQEVAVAPVLPNVPKSPTDMIHVGRPTRYPGENLALTSPGYSIQVASSQNIADSERLQQKYLDLGFQAYIMPVDLGNKGTLYRVLVGKLATKEEAEQLKHEILRKAAHLAKDPLIKFIE